VAAQHGLWSVFTGFHAGPRTVNGIHLLEGLPAANSTRSDPAQNVEYRTRNDE
jgi:hypothetical protein